MNKSIIIGVVVVIIAIIIGTTSSLNLEKNDDSSTEDIEEITPVPENTGRNLSVELSENFGLSSP